MKLSRAEAARLNDIRQWVREQEQARTLVRRDPVARSVVTAIQALFPSHRVEDAVDTPVSHVKWLLAVIGREGVEPS